MILWVKNSTRDQLDDSSVPCGIDSGQSFSDIQLMDEMVQRVQDSINDVSGALAGRAGRLGLGCRGHLHSRWKKKLSLILDATDLLKQCCPPPVFSVQAKQLSLIFFRSFSLC